MTIHTTTNYGIAYVDTDTALVDLAAASLQAATTIDAALGRGGIAPPDATTQAQLAARATALEGRATALETKLPGVSATAAVVSAPLAAGWAAGAALTYRVYRSVVHWSFIGTRASGTLGGGASAPIYTWPAALRPAVDQHPIGMYATTCLELNISSANGLMQIVTAASVNGCVASGEFLLAAAT